ncbi:hypothetical protein M6B38_203660 [Iris pallida]|uniref:Uncharacterized protein n=1 Tax=Iris pallida TaxID=29817 RepID=A0AAX6E7A1_IRIPA|nr:hypothetical protein M6B38_203660 [Iris pallida]
MVGFVVMEVVTIIEVGRVMEEGMTKHGRVAEKVTTMVATTKAVAIRTMVATTTSVAATKATTMRAEIRIMYCICI